MTEWWQWLLFWLGNVPVIFGIGWLFFDSFEDLWEAIKFWVTPDFLSCLAGRCFMDFVHELRLGGFIAACAIVLATQYELLTRFVLS